METRSVEVGLAGFYFVGPAICGALSEGSTAPTQSQLLQSLPETLALASSGGLTVHSRLLHTAFPFAGLKSAVPDFKGLTKSLLLGLGQDQTSVRD